MLVAALLVTSLVTPAAGSSLPQHTFSPDALDIQVIGQIGGPAYAVAVVGGYAYVGVGPRLAILNVTNPANPTLLGLADSARHRT
ncbi:MAG: hypothetical protein HZY76_21675 [Anaerolineae bacterium]|nr:MAG: hypothetical protein HZY76_21675 [Anaerolineae bacterium]